MSVITDMGSGVGVFSRSRVGSVFVYVRVCREVLCLCSVGSGGGF